MREKRVRVSGIEITHPERIIYPKEKITKLDVVRYYEKISKKIMPFLKNRLVSEIRCYTNFSEKFYKKHPQKNALVESFYVGKKSKQNEYFYINSKKQLISEVQLGAVEFHIWNSRIIDINHPDLMIFDLDPDENLPLTKLREGVMLLKKILTKLKLKCSLKTSGGKGYHIFVKVNNMTTKKVANLSKQIAVLLEEKYPNIFVTNMSKENRKNKIFIDYLRNKRGATCVAPYSLRLRENAPISVPIPFSQLNKIAPSQINLLNYK